MFAKIRPRRGTKTQWETANTVLAEGEIGFEVPDDGVGTGITNLKIGDGTTAWNDLPYAIDTASVNESLEKKRLNTYTTFSQINEEYSASNFVYCNMPNNSTLSVSLSAAGGENGFANALIPVSSGGTLFVERIGGRGRIEYCDTSRNVHYAYVSDFSKITSNSNVVWDSYASNSDLATKSRAISDIILQGNGGSKTLTLPSKAQGIILIFPNANVSGSTIKGVYAFGMRGASTCQYVPLVEASDIAIEYSGLTMTFTNNNTSYNAYMSVIYSASADITVG